MGCEIGTLSRPCAGGCEHISLLAPAAHISYVNSCMYGGVLAYGGSSICDMLRSIAVCVCVCIVVGVSCVPRAVVSHDVVLEIFLKKNRSTAVKVLKLQRTSNPLYL